MRVASPCEAERRQFPRVTPAASPNPGLVRLRAGGDATLVNISHGGVCVEASSPLRPGAPIDVRVTLPDWQWQGQAQILRCRVSALPRDQKVRYLAALQFATSGDGRWGSPASVVSGG